MALFTDFFPSSEAGTASNSGQILRENGSATITSITGNVAVVTLGAGLTGSQVGAIVSFTRASDDHTFAGVITAHTAGAAALTVMFTDVAGAGTALAAGQTGVANVSMNGQTIVEGDNVVAGDTHVGGDTNINGDLTADGDVTLGGGDIAAGGGDTIIGIGTGDGDSATERVEVEIGTGDFSTVVIGDDEGNTGSETTIHGDTVNLGDDANTTVTNIDGVTTNLNSETINIGDGNDGTTTIGGGQLDVDAETINLGDGTDGTVTVAGENFVITATNVDLGDGAFGSGDGQVATWAEGDNTDEIPRNKLPNFTISEVHELTLTDAQTTDTGGVPSTADIAGHLNAITTANTEEANEGDVFIVTGTAASPSTDTVTQSFIYINSTAKAFTATNFVAADFRALSSGLSVDAIMAVDGQTTVDAATGDVTVGLDFSDVADDRIIYKNSDDELTGSLLIQSGVVGTSGLITASENFTVGGVATVNGNLIANGEANVIGDDNDGTTTINGGTFTANPNMIFLGDNNAEGDITLRADDINITGGDTGIVIDPSNGPARIGGVGGGGGSSRISVDSRAEGQHITLAAQNQNDNANITIRNFNGDGDDRGDGNIEIHSGNGSLDLTTDGTGGEALHLDATAGGITIESVEAIQLESNAVGSTNGKNISLTTTPGTGASTGGDILIRSLANAGSATSTAGNIIVQSAGIIPPAAGETAALGVNRAGEVVTIVGGAGFTLLIGTDADITTNSGGDLVVLPPITADRNLNLPADPVAGTSFEVSNLSATGAGSGTFRWSIGATDDVVMGTTLTDTSGPLELDDNTASFKMVYTNATYGWVIIGAN